jgi:hypothetical protein
VWRCDQSGALVRAPDPEMYLTCLPSTITYLSAKLNFLVIQPAVLVAPSSRAASWRMHSHCLADAALRSALRWRPVLSAAASNLSMPKIFLLVPDICMLGWKCQRPYTPL